MSTFRFFENHENAYDPKLKIWRGIKLDPVCSPDSSIGAEVLKSLLRNPEHINQISYTSGKQFTDGEMATMSIRVAQHFRDHLKMPQGVIIGLCASSSDYVAPLFYGAMLAGLVVSTLDPHMDKNGTKHIFSMTEPTMIFCDGLVYKQLKEAMDELQLKARIFTMNKHIAGVPEITEFLQETGSEDAFKPEPLKDGWNQTCAIVTSSGTTGPPKGVCLTHSGFMNIHSGDITFRNYLCFSTLYWVSGINSLYMSAIKGITRIISEKPFNNADFFNIVEKYKVECLTTPPAYLALLVSDPQINVRDLTSLKLCMSGGSMVPDVCIAKIKSVAPNLMVWTTYGMTEVNGETTYCLEPHANFVGRVGPNLEMKIIDDDGNRLGPNETGEVCILPQFLCGGYYKNPVATAQTFVDGWIHTGDMGYFSEENNLYIVGRKKDVLKYQGYSFAPTDIESVIYGLKSVAHVCVCGIPDEVSEFLPAAAIIRVPGSQLTEQEVVDYVAKNAAPFKQLRGGVYFVEALPKTPSGKVMRRKVTEICIQMRAENSNEV